jgi:hypothetical protein
MENIPFRAAGCILYLYADHAFRLGSAFTVAVYRRLNNRIHLWNLMAPTELRLMRQHRSELDAQQEMNNKANNAVHSTPYSVTLRALALRAARSAPLPVVSDGRR